MDDDGYHKSKCIYIDETGSQSSCSATDDYIASQIENMELVFKREEEEVEEEVRVGSTDDNIDAYSSDSRLSSDADDTIRNCSETDFSDNESLVDFETLVKKKTSPFLFRNENFEPLTFVLLLNDTSAERRLAKLIERGGGLVYSKVKDMDDYSMVIVKDNLLIGHVGPVFKLDYLFKCITKNKIVSINGYLRTFDCAPALHRFDYMNVVYFKQVGWSEVPKCVLLNKLVADIRKVKVEKIRTPPPSPTTIIIDDDDDEYNASKPHPKKDCPPTLTQHTKYKKLKMWAASSSDSSDNDSDTNWKVHKTTPTEAKRVKHRKMNKHTRMSYSDAEDMSIVKYIVDNDGYNNIKGTMLWKDMERVNICPKRTWQSMKEHFLKKIMYNTYSYSFLSDSQKRKFQKLLLK